MVSREIQPSIKREKATRTTTTRTKMIMVGSPYVLRAEKEITGWWDQSYMEKRQRQVFLRSYQFSRKRSSVARIKRSVIRVRRLIWLRLRATPKLPRLLWFRLRSRYGHGYCYGSGRTRFQFYFHFHFHRSMKF